MKAVLVGVTLSVAAGLIIVAGLGAGPFSRRTRAIAAIFACVLLLGAIVAATRDRSGPSLPTAEILAPQNGATVGPTTTIHVKYDRIRDEKQDLWIIVRLFGEYYPFPRCPGLNGAPEPSVALSPTRSSENIYNIGNARTKSGAQFTIMAVLTTKQASRSLSVLMAPRGFCGTGGWSGLKDAELPTQGFDPLDQVSVTRR